MPTFDYQCGKCGNVQEEFHSISATPKISCSECGSGCDKIFTPSGNFVLKGNNWPSKDARLKKDMTRKNSKMKRIMSDRENSGEAVRSVEDLKKIK